MRPVFAVRQVSHEGLGTIADALRRCDVPYTIVDAFGENLPVFEPRQVSGLVVMGGPMNVDETDRYPFLAAEVDWLQRAIDSRLPVLGVCLGAQLLAKALGSRVYPNRVKEIGWYEVELLPETATDPLFCDAPSRPTIFHWHGDTFDLPAGSVQLARSPQCENQAFRHGKSAYGLQFHMEVTSQIIDSWLRESGNCGELAELNYIDPDAIRRQTPQKLPTMESLGGKVFDRFAQMCRNCT